MIRQPTTTLLSLTLGFILLTPAPPASAEEGAKEQPPAIKAMLTRMVGTWTGKDVSVNVGGRSMKAQGRVMCARSAGGGVACHVQASMPGMKDEETQLVGWDPENGKVHLFAVNPRYTHDHVGTLDGNVLSLAFSGTRDGKPWDESMTFTFNGDRELVWKDTCTSGGQVVFSGEGTYRK
jgi:hypothetical protein